MVIEARRAGARCLDASAADEAAARANRIRMNPAASLESPTRAAAERTRAAFPDAVSRLAASERNPNEPERAPLGAISMSCWIQPLHMTSLSSAVQRPI